MRKRSSRHVLNLWPGFVDALSTILMISIFVLMVFILGQFILGERLTSRDTILKNLQHQLEGVRGDLSKTKEERDQRVVDLAQTQAQVTQLKTLLTQIRKDLESQKTDEKLRVADYQKEIETAQEKSKNLLTEVEELKALVTKQNELLAFQQYRSKFFAQLKDSVGDNPNLKVTGDRFVLPSEILFGLASAEIGADGKRELKKVATLIKEISGKIPKDTNWVLRIDGHTDSLALRAGGAFASNWELSAARAISVLKFLVEEGIAPERLVAAGFGEHAPITTKSSEISKNRRIEFKLDQR